MERDRLLIDRADGFDVKTREKKNSPPQNETESEA